jgi:hypothetical protein
MEFFVPYSTIDLYGYTCKYFLSNTNIDIVPDQNGFGTATIFRTGTGSVIFYQQFLVDTDISQVLLTNDIDGNNFILYYYIGTDLSVIESINLSQEYNPNVNFPSGYGWSLISGPQNSTGIASQVPAGSYIAFLYTTGFIDIQWGDLIFYETNITISGLPITGACFAGSTEIIMKDHTKKLLKDIKVGDEILEDKITNKIGKVEKVSKAYLAQYGYKIEQGLINNTDTLICSNHPIWCNNSKNRIFPSEINGSERIPINQVMFDLLLDNEGTFYANNIKVDSLPPLKDHKYDGEDDPIRQKPKMTTIFDSIDTYDNNIYE